MISNRLKKELERSLKLAKYFGSSPFSVTETPVWKLFVDSKRYSHLCITYSVSILAAFGGILVVLKHYLNNNMDMLHLAMSWLGGLAVLIFTNTCFTFQAEQLCDSYNALNQFLAHIKDEFAPALNADKPKGIFLLFELGVVIFKANVYWIHVLFMSLLLWNPRAFIFLGALVPPEYYNFFAYLCVVVFHSLVMTSLHLKLAHICEILMTYSFYLYVLIVREMKPGRKRGYITSPAFRTAGRIQLTFRSLQLLHQHILLQCRLGEYLVGFNGISMLSMIYILFVLLRFWGRLNWIAKMPMVFASVFAMATYTAILQLCCFFFVRGSKTLSAWKRHTWRARQENKEMKVFCRSCKPLVYSYGKQFVLGRIAILNFYRGVTRGTFRALLTTK